MMALTTIPARNEPISVEALSTLLAEELAGLEEQVDGHVSLQPLGPQKDVADSTTKVLVRTQSGLPAAVILCSRPIAPDLVQRGTDNAEAIREIIGEELGQAIIQPIASGYVDGCSYVILPYCRDFSSWRLRRFVQRLRIQRPLLRWLRKATAKGAARHGGGDDARQAFASVLRHLEHQRLFDNDIQDGIHLALERLDSGRWSPRHAFDHNDLWLGNVLFAPRNESASRTPHPFVLIDWAGANPVGYGVYDLIRVSHDLRLSGAALRRELLAHSMALECDVMDTPGHLLAACGRLHQQIEHFPEQRFVHTVQRCWMRIGSALSASR